MDDRRVELQFDWVPLKPLTELPARIAVSRLVGVADARLVHLPTMALYPTVAWRMGEVVRERVSVVFPADAVEGDHQLVVGWYDTDNTWAAQTDSRSRIGAEVQLGSVRLAGQGGD